MSYLKVHDLSVRYPFQHKPVLKGCNLSVNKGEKVLILGPSGGGKSTLALTLNGIIPKSLEAEMNGTVTLDGQSPNTLSFREISQHIGILFQDPETQFCMQTVADEILFGLENLRLSKAEMEHRLEESLRLVGLTDVRNARLRELSGGMKQKLGIACLLAMNPEVLILDEPTANLDPASTREIFELMIHLSDTLNKTLIFIEHKLDHLIPYLERIIVLDKDGEIMADGSPRDVFEQNFSAIMEQGIWMPYLFTYAKDLEKKGMIWSKFPLTLEEWYAEIEKQGLALPQAACLDGMSYNLGDPNHPSISSTYVSQKEVTNESIIASNGFPILQLENVSFSYKAKPVLKNINVSIQTGDFIAIVGPNGTGKSTLTQLLIGLQKPQSGKIKLKGSPVKTLKVNEWMQQIGFVFQNPEHQFVCDTVENELAYGLEILGWNEEECQQRVNDLLKQFYLTKQRKHNPFSLSQGQKRRLSVATMLTNDQQILILDEPTFGQDHVNTTSLMNLLEDLNKSGKTILMVTHDMELVYKYANKVLLINGGEVAYDGDVQSFFEHRALLERAMIKVPISYTLQPWLRAFEGGRYYARTVSK